jgi:hypothetical protein
VRRTDPVAPSRLTTLRLVAARMSAFATLGGCRSDCPAVTVGRPRVLAVHSKSAPVDETV